MIDQRGVSTVMSYMLTLTVIALLTTGLFATAGTLLENQEERAIRYELDVIGNRLASGISGVDQLALASRSNGTAELETELPIRVVDYAYRIRISRIPGTADHYRIMVSTSNPTVVVEVRVRAATDVVETSMTGGDVVFAYNGSAVEVRRG